MNVQELVANIHNKDFDLEKRLGVKKYLPIELKKTIAQSIIYECTENDGGAIKVDSVQRYLSYVRYMITNHTNLEYTDEDYDILCSTRYKNSTLLNEVCNIFDSDATECNRILGLMMEDYLTNNSPENVIVEAVTDFVNMLTSVVNVISDKVSDVDLMSIIPTDLNIESLTKFLNDNYKK